MIGGACVRTQHDEARSKNRSKTEKKRGMDVAARIHGENPTPHADTWQLTPIRIWGKESVTAIWRKQHGVLKKRKTGDLQREKAAARCDECQKLEGKIMTGTPITSRDILDRNIRNRGG